MSDYRLFLAALRFKGKSLKSYASEFGLSPKRLRREFQAGRAPGLLVYAEHVFEESGFTRPAKPSEDSRDRIKVFMKTKGLSQAKTARAIHLKAPDFSTWLRGIYKGNNEKLAAKVSAFLDAQAKT